MFAKRYIVYWALSVLLWLPFGQALAQYQKQQLQHFINLSAAGGLDVGLSGSGFVRPGIGGDGQFAVAYELQNKGFFFNIGLGADYRVMNYALKGKMTHAFASQDKDGHPISYRYVYTGYSETQQTLYATLPIWLGYIIRERVYIAVGAKAALPLWNTFEAKTKMYTEGVYTNLIDPVSQNVPSFAYYPKSTYSGKGTYTTATAYVYPMAEAGVVFELDKKITCRLGAFAEYAIPIGGACPHTDIVDYSAVDMNPQTRSQENLKAGLGFNSMLNGKMNTSATANAGQNLLNGWSSFLSVGVRATFNFNVTKYKSECRCIEIYK